MKSVGVFVVVVVALAALLFSTGTVIVNEAHHAVVVQLGDPVRTLTEPGLYWKTPFVQSAVFFEKRILEYDSDPAEIVTRDKKNLVVDKFAKWRIVDPLLFLQTVRTENGAQARLDDIIYSELRVELGRHTMHEVVALNRELIMQEVTRESNRKAREFGIEVLDVRIKRADLPKDNEQAVFGRMRSERERQARQYRSEGQEAATRIRAQADRQREVVLAEAYREAQAIRGQGDAEALRIYAESFNRDPEFYAFLRSLEVYEATLKDKTKLILSANSEFLKYLTQPAR